MISTKNYKELTKENIFEKISSYDIFYNYIPQFDSVSRSFRSPLRDDKNPDVRIFKTKGGIFMYKDFAHPKHTFSAIGFVMEAFGLAYYEALEKINRDFNLKLGKTVYTNQVYNAKVFKKEFLNSIKAYKDIKIVSTDYTQGGLNYFAQYGINKNTLIKFKVKQIKGYYLNYSYFPVYGFAYCFGNYNYKILQPLEKEFKWVSNAGADVFQGWEQLPEKGDICFITSSLKDVMVLDTLNYTAIAPQSEAGKIPEHIVEELKNRFKEVIIFYDNDKPGIAAARQLSRQTGFSYTHIPEEVEQKDPSDFSKHYGINELRDLLDTII